MLQGRILVTGAAGYVGSVLCRQLLEQGFLVRGVDALLFGAAGIAALRTSPAFEFVQADLCGAGVAESSVKGVEAVIHLAAIVGDPACERYPVEAAALMDAASRTLFEAAEAAGARKFIFASTCSNYGQMEGEGLLGENAPLRPLSHYSRLKVGFEKYLLQRMPGSPAAITVLRFATAYGLSPRMRFDLTVNHFTRDLAFGRRLEVFGLHQWRPYGHVEDLASAAVLALNQPPSRSAGIFNIGDSSENYSKAMLIDEVLKEVPDGRVVLTPDNGSDRRNYRVDFSKAGRQLGFKTTRRVPDGIREILSAFCLAQFRDPFDPVYQNCQPGPGHPAGPGGSPEP
ncbi:MAG: hypothetical protein RLZZ165_2511 [Bacteroidota bacterium]